MSRATLMRYWSLAPTLTSGETFSSSSTWIMWLTVSAPMGECSVSKTSQSKGSPWRMSLTSGFPIVTHAPYETPCTNFFLRLLFKVALLRERLRDKLSDVLYEKLGASRGLRCVFKHRDAEGAGNRENVGSSFFSFLHPDHSDLLSFRNLIPYVRASAAAAEAVQSASLHLQKLETCGRLQDISRCVEDTVHPPEVAGVVLRHSLVELSDPQPLAPHHLAV